MAMLGIHRELAFGANVPDWKTVGVPLGLWISYHRTAVLLPDVIECEVTSDSWLPKLRYASRNMSRSPSVSSCWLVPGCGIHVPPVPPHASVYDGTVMAIGPVSVVLFEFAKSTWNL